MNTNEQLQPVQICDPGTLWLGCIAELRAMMQLGPFGGGRMNFVALLFWFVKMGADEKSLRWLIQNSARLSQPFLSTCLRDWNNE